MPYIVTDGKWVVTKLLQDSPYRQIPLIDNEGPPLFFDDRHEAERVARDLNLSRYGLPPYRVETREGATCS